MGFFYMITDRELGELIVDPERPVPVAEDPSLWGEAGRLIA